MALTREECRRLDEIERRLSRVDPPLERMLASGQAPRSRTNRYGRWLALGAFVTLTIGIAIQQPAVCAAGWLGLLVGGLMVSTVHLDLSAPPGAGHP